MEKLDKLVALHIEHRLLAPERLEEVLASVLDRRQKRTKPRRQHIAKLNKRAAEADIRLKRLYEAIETGSKAAAIDATISVPWPRGLRLPTTRSASWGRRTICSERSPPFPAQNRLLAAFAVLLWTGGLNRKRSSAALLIGV
jgi:hypothetical protein